MNRLLAEVGNSGQTPRRRKTQAVRPFLQSLAGRKPTPPTLRCGFLSR